MAFAILVAELTARAVVAHFMAWPRERLASLGRATYPDLRSYQPHPFLQFTGRPSRTLRGNAALSATSQFNREGFVGGSVKLEKPSNTCRIVCLGGSTTASGYPGFLADWLGENSDHDEQYQSVNLAHGFYNSAHSVVNFVLNGLDYSPDYVVVHHGWNDGHGAQNASDFRGDYSHILKAFDPSVAPDWLPIRASVIYRAVRFQFFRDDDWRYLEKAVLHPMDHDDFDYERAAATFRRNIRTIVDLSLRRGVTPVLATMPYSTAEHVVAWPSRRDVGRFAEELRSIAALYSGQVLLVDLDREFSGRNELFLDYGHMTRVGRLAKAEKIGVAILEHRSGG